MAVACSCAQCRNLNTRSSLYDKTKTKSADLTKTGLHERLEGRGRNYRSTTAAFRNVHVSVENEPRSHSILFGDALGCLCTPCAASVRTEKLAEPQFFFFFSSLRL